MAAAPASTRLHGPFTARRCAPNCLSLPATTALLASASTLRRTMSKHSRHSLSNTASRWLLSAPRLRWPLASPTRSQQQASPCSAHRVPRHSSSGRNHSLAKSLPCCSCHRPHGQHSSRTPNSPQHSVGGAPSATRSWSSKLGSLAAKAWWCHSTTKRAKPPFGHSSTPVQ